MSNERGTTMMEVLVTSLVAGIIFLGLSSLYLATTRAFGDSNSQLSLQRQGTLALQEISQRIQSGAGAGAITTATCNGRPDSVQVSTPDGTFCYYAGATGTADAGKLCEYTVGGGAGCRNLLYGALQPHGPTPIALLIQPATASPRCPAGVVANTGCFVGTVLDPTRAEFRFAITDGLNVMSFEITLTCSGRNYGC